MKITVERKNHIIEYELKTLIKRLIFLILIITSIFYTYNYIKINEQNEKIIIGYENNRSNSNDNYYEELVIKKNSKGSFKSLDSKVKVEGTLTLINIKGKQNLQFSNNFKVTNNPNLYLYLSTTPAGKEKIKISKLLGNIGIQTYPIEGKVNFNVHKYLVIVDSISNKPLVYAQIQ